jgi:putative MFS transporter
MQTQPDADANSVADLVTDPITDTSDQTRDILARLDRLRTTRRHIVWIAVLGVGYLIETFDNTVFGYVAPSIRAEWHLSIGSVGVMTSAVFYGMMAGGLVGGYLLDRFGRKPVLVAASICYSLASLFCAAAPNFEALFAGRVLTGFAVQAATGAILVYVSEMFPRLSRGRFFTAVIFFGYLGAPMTSFTAAAIAPTSTGAWRWLFVLGSAGVLVAAATIFLLPETIRWLTLNARQSEALGIVEDLEALDRKRGDLNEILDVPSPPQNRSYRVLFTRQYARRLMVVTAAFGGILFCQYGFAAYLATILVGRGMSTAQALDAASIITLGTLAAAPIVYLVADRVERKTALLGEAAVTAVGLATFGNADSTRALIVAGFITYAGLAGLVTTIYNYVPEIFPTEIRGVGTGTVNGISRFAGVASALVVASLYVNMAIERLFIVLATIVTLSGLIAFAFGPRTTKRTLETISPEPPRK